MPPNKIQIAPFEMKYASDFKELNEAWISQYFKMERMDYQALDHPKEYILDNGGYIAVALKGETVVGVCALIKMKDSQYDFELAKMGVSPLEQGQGIGFLLGTHIIKKAEQLGASTVYLESNTKLVPALKLYRKLGFVEMEGFTSPYERCDIQMVYTIE
ncbi:GNAT family N-acetyltransferase [Flagellimonas meridianipacifica]|uniref:N-acetylglutamate synthase-like GNAT family acetyltransferase n=1 Tax=Flagellimonas meridianipacifica TaxID=1080225 RepID=A0A2T0M9U5_9FLAO|nr:GNAT family N-acetyltransferase [Allomuricauda pacifica]PRX54307.1 N-acetylglutamate synthase-like GNAT family acetyltransferase [Allomuricauda pacifica]